MTDWDEHYMKRTPLIKPTNLDPLYPHPWGHWEKINTDPWDRWALWFGRMLAVATITFMGMACWSYFA